MIGLLLLTFQAKRSSEMMTFLSVISTLTVDFEQIMHNW